MCKGGCLSVSLTSERILHKLFTCFRIRDSVRGGQKLLRDFQTHAGFLLVKWRIWKRRIPSLLFSKDQPERRQSGTLSQRLPTWYWMGAAYSQHHEDYLIHIIKIQSFPPSSQAGEIFLLLFLNFYTIWHRILFCVLIFTYKYSTQGTDSLQMRR